MTMTMPDSSTPGETPEPSSSLNDRTPERFQGKNEASRKEIRRLIDWANKNFSATKNERSAFERQWHLNYAFYKGRQNVVFRNADSQYNRSFSLYTPPAPYFRARPVINKIRPIARRQMAKLTAQKPSVSVVPQSSDDRDMYAAQAAEQIWEYIYETRKVAVTIRRAVFWTVIDGIGFIKSWWDPNEVDYLTGDQGNICYEHVTPFHLFIPDLKCEEIEYQPFVLHAQLMSADALSAKLKRPINYESGKGLDDNYATMLGVQQWQQDRTCLAMEYWVKPGQYAILPDGGMFIIAGNQLVSITEGLPYTHGQYPFAKLSDVHTGQFYPDSVVQDLIPLQREYNRTRGQIIEAKNRMSKPQIDIEKGAYDPNKITSEPGLILERTPGFEPARLLQPAQLPAYVENELLRIQADMDDISGQHDVSRGDTPAGVSAATAISYLQEADDTMLSFTYDSVEEAVEKLAKLTLSYVHDYWTDEKVIKVTGIDESFDVLSFRGSDIPSQADIRVEGGSALPTSKAARQAFLMDLMDRGYVPPDQGLKIMEIGGLDSLFKRLKIDEAQAGRENLKMRQVDEKMLADYQQQAQQELIAENADNPNVRADESGQLWDYSADPSGQNIPPEPLNPPLIVPVNSWDNHMLHIQVHNDYRKSQSFEQLDKPARDLFEQHVQSHVMAMQSDYNMQMNTDPSQLMMQQPAAPVAPPNPSGENQFSDIPAADEQPSQFGGLDNGSAPN